MRQHVCFLSQEIQNKIDLKKKRESSFCFVICDFFFVHVRPVPFVYKPETLDGNGGKKGWEEVIKGLYKTRSGFGAREISQYSHKYFLFCSVSKIKQNKK